MVDKKAQNFAKKSLGQNFLNNPNVRDRILKEAGDISGKNILEIGPGLGFLTRALLESKANLTAIEFDERAVKILQKTFKNPEFKLIEGNFLEQDLDEIFEQKNYSIIANIPYNITNPILRKILEKTKNKPHFAILMVQKEVAQKICDPISHLIEAKPEEENIMFGVPLQGVSQSSNTRKKSKRSILSIAVEVYAEARYCFTVPREDFDPAPKVDSAIMRLDIRSEPLVSTELQRDFFTVVNAGFSEKRKKLGNVLGKFFGVEPKKLLGNIDPNRRAETLEIEEWIEITKNFRETI